MIPRKLKRHARKVTDYDIEIISSKADIYTAIFKDNKIISIDTGESRAHVIQSIDKKGRSATFAINNSLTVDDLVRTIKMTKMASKDDHYQCLPSGGKYKKIGGLFDREIYKIIDNHDKEYLKKRSKEIIKSALDYNQKIGRVSGGFVCAVSEREIFNNRGVDYKDKITGCGLRVEVESINNKKNGLGSYKQFQHNLSDLNVKGVIERASDTSLEFLGAEKGTIGDIPVLLSSRAFSWMVLAPLGSMILGGNVIKGDSPLADKLDSRIASDKFTLIDDPHIYAGIGSTPCSEEGVPTRKAVLVERGILKEFILNWYIAQRMNRNAYGFNGKFRNIEIKQSAKLEDMLGGLKEYAEIVDISDYGNIMTGNYNGTSLHVRHYKNGEIKAYKRLNVTTNILDMLKDGIIDISEPDSLGSIGNKIPKGTLIKKGIIKLS